MDHARGGPLAPGANSRGGARAWRGAPGGGGGIAAGLAAREFPDLAGVTYGCVGSVRLVVRGGCDCACLCAGIAKAPDSGRRLAARIPGQRIPKLALARAVRLRIWLAVVRRTRSFLCILEFGS